MGYRYKKPSTFIGGVDRIKRLTYEVLEKHKSKFSENFTDNKKQLDNIAIIRSKGLKNKIAGNITKFIKKEHFEQELRKSQEDQLKEQLETTEEIEVDTDLPQESEETIIEIGTDDSDLIEGHEPAEEKDQ